MQWIIFSNDVLIYDERARIERTRMLLSSESIRRHWELNLWPLGLQCAGHFSTELSPCPPSELLQQHPSFSVSGYFVHFYLLLCYLWEIVIIYSAILLRFRYTHATLLDRVDVAPKQLPVLLLLLLFLSLSFSLSLLTMLSHFRYFYDCLQILWNIFF